MSVDREIMNLVEAADFLRFSVSSMHQRKDIPRHRVPGSREYRYLRSELLAWLTGEHQTVRVSESPSAVQVHLSEQHTQPVMDISSKHVYHRSPRYR
jgi:hypothetical protein